MNVIVVLSLIATTAGGFDNDLSALIDPEPYFQSRKIKVDLNEMIQRATQEPKDGKIQLEQILALRWLAAHGDMVKKDDKVRARLEEVALGKKAQDGLGFAKEYAARALAQIDGKEPPAPRAIPVDSLRSEAFTWFPQHDAGLSLFAGIDLRASGTMKAPPGSALRAALQRDEMREELYKFAEECGNIRLDRAALLYQDSGKPNSQRFLLRLTGAFDHKRVAAKIGAEAKQTREMKGPAGEPIALFSIEGFFHFSLMVVGDTDVIVLASNPDDGKRRMTELEEIVAVRAGKQAHILNDKSPLTNLLRPTPDQAIAIFAGAISKEMRASEAAKFPFPLPEQFLLHARRDSAIRVHGEATLPDAAEAGALVKAVEGALGEARKALQQPDFKLPKQTAEQVAKALDGVKVEGKQKVVTLKATLSAELIQALRSAIEAELKR